MRALDQGLTGEDVFPPGFYWNEAQAMAAVGWPMLVSFFCRMGMASEDSAFVGHLSGGGAFLHRQLGPSVFEHLGPLVITYAFLRNMGSEASDEYGPEDYLAAAGLSDMVVNILIIPPLAFNMSLNALVSQAMGSGNKKMAGTWLQLSLLWLTIGYLPVLALFFYVGPILELLGFSPKLCLLASAYAKFNVFWPIPNGWYQCMRFYFQAQGISRPAMYNNLVFLGVNAMLNWLLVFGGPFRGLGWQGLGFVGAAVSLSISRSLQPLAYWLYMFVHRKAHLETWSPWASRTYLQRDHLRSFLAMSVPQIGTLIFQAVIGQATTLLIAKLGKLAIAASAAAIASTQTFTGGLQPTLSAVGGMRVGFYLGRGEPERARAVALLSMAIGTASTGVVALVLLPLSHVIIGAVTDDEEVKHAAVHILPALLLNLFGAVVVQVGTGGILTSQGRTKMVTLISMGFELPLSLGSTALLVLAFQASLNQVYWTQAVVTLFEALVVGGILRRSDWRLYAREARARQQAGCALPGEAGSEVATEEAGSLGEHGVSMLGVAEERVVNFTIKSKDEVASEGQWTERLALAAKELGLGGGAGPWEPAGEPRATDAAGVACGGRQSWESAAFPLLVEIPMRRHTGLP